MKWIIGVLIFWVAAYALNIWLANSKWRNTRAVKFAVPAIFGITILVIWEGGTDRVCHRLWCSRDNRNPD